MAGRGAEGAAPQRLLAPGGRTQHRPHLGGQRQAGVRRPNHQVLGYIEDQSQSTELTRGPPELVQHFRIEGVHIGPRALHVLNLIWFGCIPRLSQWGEGG